MPTELKKVTQPGEAVNKPEIADNNPVISQAVKPPLNRKPVVKDIKLSARQYVRAKKFRWERTTGFLLEMKNKFGPMAKKVRPEWDQLWADFWKRSV